jgi:hypothetical protein
MLGLLDNVDAIAASANAAATVVVAVAAGAACFDGGVVYYVRSL